MADLKLKKTGFLASVKEVVVLLVVVFLIRTVGFGLYQVPTGSMETTMLVGERFFADKLTYWFVSPKHGDIIAFNDPLFYYSDNVFVRFFQDYVWGPSNWTKRVIGVPGDHLVGVIEHEKPVIYRNGQKLEEPYINQYPLLSVWKIDESEVLDLFKRGRYEQLAELVVPKSYDPSKPFDEQEFYTINPNRIFRVDSGEPHLVKPGTPIKPEKSIGALPQDTNYWTGSDVFNIHLGPDEFWVMGDNRLGSKDSRYFGPINQRLIHGRILFRIWSIDSDEAWWIVDLIKHPIEFWKKIRWDRFFQVIR